MGPVRPAHGPSSRARRRKSRFGRARIRLLTLVLLLVLGTVFAFAGVLAAASSYQYRRDLADSLVRTATAFGYTRSRDLEQLTRQADLVAADSRLQQYWDGLRLAAPGSGDAEVLGEMLRDGLQELFTTAGGDILLLVGPDGRVQVGVERPPPTAREGTQMEPSEATSPAEEGGPREKLPTRGERLDVPLLDSVFEDGEERRGYLRLQPHGAIYMAAAVPLRKGKRLEGVLLLGRRITEETLAEWGQGFSEGLVLVVSDRQVLAAHDRRAARRPSPALLGSLEKAVAGWEPPALAEGSPGSAAESPPPGTLDVGGRDWLELAVDLSGRRGQQPVGWVLFLGDTSTLEYKVTREAWILAETGLAVLAAALVLAWFGAGWVLRPLDREEGPTA